MSGYAFRRGSRNLFLGGVSGSASGYLPSDNPASLVGWYRTGVGITQSGGFASAWADQSGLGHDLLQATGTNQPAYAAGVLTFDGVDNFMEAVFALSAPAQFSILVKPITYIANGGIAGGKVTGQIMITQSTDNQAISIYAGSFDQITVSPVVLNSYHAISAMVNGASSKLRADAGADATGNPGANANPAGVGIGNFNNIWFGNIAVKELIVRNVDDATIRTNDHAYLQTIP